MKTLTVYYCPEQSMAHTLTCKVNEDSGQHEVVTSTLNFVAPHRLDDYLSQCERMVGKENFRAYTVTEIKR